MSNLSPLVLAHGAIYPVNIVSKPDVDTRISFVGAFFTPPRHYTQKHPGRRVHDWAATVHVARVFAAVWHTCAEHVLRYRVSRNRLNASVQRLADSSRYNRDGNLLQ